MLEYYGNLPTKLLSYCKFKKLHFSKSQQKQYETALIQYKMIDIKNSFEDLTALARVFYKLGKYQQCSKSKNIKKIFWHIIKNWFMISIRLVFENAMAICSETERSIVYTGMGMAQSKYNIQEAITSFFKGFIHFLI